jgi:hypothetical protein
MAVGGTEALMPFANVSSFYHLSDNISSTPGDVAQVQVTQAWSGAVPRTHSFMSTGNGMYEDVFQVPWDVPLTFELTMRSLVDALFLNGNGAATADAANTLEFVGFLVTDEFGNVIPGASATSKRCDARQNLTSGNRGYRTSAKFTCALRKAFGGLGRARTKLSLRVRFKTLSAGL